MSLTNYFVMTNYMRRIQNDSVSCAIPGANTGLVSNACGLAAQRGCESVKMAVPSSPLDQCVERDHNIGRKANKEAPRPWGDNNTKKIISVSREQTQ